MDDQTNKQKQVSLRTDWLPSKPGRQTGKCKDRAYVFLFFCCCFCVCVCVCCCCFFVDFFLCVCFLLLFLGGRKRGVGGFFSLFFLSFFVNEVQGNYRAWSPIAGAAPSLWKRFPIIISESLISSKRFPFFTCSSRSATLHYPPQPPSPCPLPLPTPSPQPTPPHDP